METLLRQEPAGTRKSLFANPLVQLGLFIALSILLVASSFGDTNRHVDETFYFLVGQRMHDGLLPYVDIWDRKPIGLFLIYYAIAGISHSVLAYQITACLFSALTAYIVSQIVKHMTCGGNGLLAGLCYLLVICTFEGDRGQAPDFYNLFIALAALLVVQQMSGLLRDEIGWRSLAAMALCGVAITVKQTALFESLFFGLYVLVSLLRAGAPMARVTAFALLFALIGAAPMLLAALFYFQIGHWPEFWHAMVTSNISKAHVGGEAWRLLGICLTAAVIVILAIWGLLTASVDRRSRQFLSLWLVAALVGFLSVPNFYGHYMLPLMVPLSVAAGLLFALHSSRLVFFIGLLVYSSFWYSPFQAEWTRKSNGSMQAMAKLIQQHDRGGGLFVFDGQPYLYALTGKRFLSPLVFPHHLSQQIENNVSHLDTHAEIDRIIAAKPGVVVMSQYPRNFPINMYSRARVVDYARRHCRVVGMVQLYEKPIELPMAVFGDCR